MELLTVRQQYVWRQSDTERQCWTCSNMKLFGVTECEMTRLGTAHTGCTLGEVESFENGVRSQN